MPDNEHLREHARALNDLVARLSQYVTSAEASPVAGSPMSIALDGLCDRGQAATELLFDARNRAVAATTACAEHVLATARLLDAPERYYSAEIVVRAAFEIAGLACWLLDSAVPPETLVARYLGRAREEQDHALRFLRDTSVDDDDGNEQLAALRGQIAALKSLTVAAAEEIGIEPIRIGATKLAKYGGDGPEYEIYSGSTHGRLGSLMETLNMAADDAGSATLFMGLVSAVGRSYFIAVDALLRFVTGVGIEDAEVAQIAESLGLVPEALQAPARA